MVHKSVQKSKQAVLQHLKEDSETWKKLSVKADKEYKSDLKLIKKIKKSC